MYRDHSIGKPVFPLSMKKRVKFKTFFGAELVTGQLLQLSSGFWVPKDPLKHKMNVKFKNFLFHMKAWCEPLYIVWISHIENLTVNLIIIPVIYEQLIIIITWIMKLFTESYCLVFLTNKNGESMKDIWYMLKYTVGKIEKSWFVDVINSMN